MTEHRIVQTVTKHYGRCSSLSSDGDVQTVVLSSRTQQLLCVFSLAVQKEREKEEEEKKGPRSMGFVQRACDSAAGPTGWKRKAESAKRALLSRQKETWTLGPGWPEAERDERFLSVVWAFSDTPPPAPLSPPPPRLPPSPQPRHRPPPPPPHHRPSPGPVLLFCCRCDGRVSAVCEASCPVSRRFPAGAVSLLLALPLAPYGGNLQSSAERVLGVSG